MKSEESRVLESLPVIDSPRIRAGTLYRLQRG